MEASTRARLVRFLFVLSWRFFTGSHMDGKHRTHGRGTVLPRYRDYYWNRYSRKKRALIRWGIAGLGVSILFGWYEDWDATRYALLAVTPFVLSRVLMKFINAVTMVTKYTDSDGVEDRYRVLKPKYARAIRERKPAKIRATLPDNGPVPPEYQRAVMADNAEEHGEPIMNMRFAKEIQEANNDTRSRRFGRRPTARVGKS